MTSWLKQESKTLCMQQQCLLHHLSSTRTSILASSKAALQVGVWTCLEDLLISLSIEDSGHEDSQEVTKMADQSDGANEPQVPPPSASDLAPVGRSGTSSTAKRRTHRSPHNLASGSFNKLQRNAELCSQALKQSSSLPSHRSCRQQKLSNHVQAVQA